jgi:serine-type D-Ala-D-Ala carboxypeptidase/endopeptidase (penicillin-binding protein 4)
LVRQWSRRGVWLAGAGAAVLLAVAVLMALTLVRPGPADDEAVRFEPPVPPPPPEVLAAATGDAPMPSPDGVHDAIDGIVRDSALGEVSALVLDAVTGTELYAHEPDRTAVPASTIKLVTAATVLAARGPAHQLATVAVAGEEPGEVVLVGGGDPTLAVDEGGIYPQAARLDDLAAQVRARLGDIEITSVTVDSGLFTGEVHGPWDTHIRTSGFVGPVTALMTDGGRVEPDEVRAAAARWPEPDLAAGEAFGRLLDVDAEVERGQAPPSAGAGPPATPGGSPTVNPTVTAGSPDPDGVVPGTELGRVMSPPMLRMVEIMLADSDNVLAEALARQVALARGEPASYAGAAAAMTGVLKELGVPLGDSVLADGSGLSRGNRLSPTLLADLLAAVLDEPQLAGMLAGLPVAGWSGTLAERYRSPQPDTGPGAGVVRAKTGNLAGVSTLAGLVVTADGRLLTFALMANESPFEARDGLDRIAATLATCGCT